MKGGLAEQKNLCQDTSQPAADFFDAECTSEQSPKTESSVSSFELALPLDVDGESTLASPPRYSSFIAANATQKASRAEP